MQTNNKTTKTTTMAPCARPSTATTAPIRFPHRWASSPIITTIFVLLLMLSAGVMGSAVEAKSGGPTASVVDTFEERVLMKEVAVTSETLCQEGDDKSEFSSNPAVQKKASKPVDLAVQATIEGEEAQIVTIVLKPGQTIRTRPNTMLYREEGIQMKTHMPREGAAARFLSDTPLFLVDYINTEENKEATVALSARRPEKILRINLDDHDGELTIRKGAFLVGSPELEMSIKRSSKSVLAQLFGGQGLLLQTLYGKGSVLLRSGGVQIKKRLKDDERLRIHPASLVAFSNGVSYNVTKSTSFNNVVFGDESLFVTTVSGPGTVWLQGMHPKFFTRTETHTVESSSSSRDSDRKSDSSSSGSSSTRTSS